jgi:hypothetical protein
VPKTVIRVTSPSTKVVPEQQAQWGWKKESELFAQLDRIAQRDPHVVATRDRPLPPTVLTLLVENAKNPRDLLDQALRMREEDEWKDYRCWYARLRKAWADGRHDAAAEMDVHRVTEEIRTRLAQRQKKGEPGLLRETEIAFKADAHEKAKFKGKVELSLPGVKVGGEVDNLRLQLPARLRNWYVDTFRMHDHCKLLMRMSLAQGSYDISTRGLEKVWKGRA